MANSTRAVTPTQEAVSTRSRKTPQVTTPLRNSRLCPIMTPDSSNISPHNSTKRKATSTNNDNNSGKTSKVRWYNDPDEISKANSLRSLIINEKGEIRVEVANIIISVLDGRNDLQLHEDKLLRSLFHTASIDGRTGTHVKLVTVKGKGCVRQKLLATVPQHYNIRNSESARNKRRDVTIGNERMDILGNESFADRFVAQHIKENDF